MQIDDEPRGTREGEVLHQRGTLEVDHDLDPAGRRQNAHTFHFPVADAAVPPAGRRPRKGPGNNDSEQESDAS